MMDESRRSFLKEAGYTALGLGCGFPLLSVACSASKEGSAAGSPPTQWAMVIDIQKCLREEVRRACSEACHRVHNVPDIRDTEDPDSADREEEIKWIWTEQFQHAFPDQSHEHAGKAMKETPVLVLCNHCKKPSCVRVCPTRATWKRKQDGIVMMDMHRCIGCRYCMAACPYGSRSFNWRDPLAYIPRDKDGRMFSDYPPRSKGVVEKCDFCAERIRAGGPEPSPACVEAANSVPGGRDALVFGDLTNPESKVSRILREKRTICRRVSLGTGPNVFYVV